MFDALRVLAARQRGLVSARQAIAAGMQRHEIASEVRAGRWIVVMRGVYLIDPESHALPLPTRTLFEAVILARGPGSLLVATSAAAVFRWQGLPIRPTEIEVATVRSSVTRARAARRDDVELPEHEVRIVPRQLAINPSEVIVVDGLPVRIAELTIIDAALEVDRPTALALMDSALRSGDVDAEQLARAVAGAAHRPGIVAVRELARLADSRAESQVESRVRLACIDGDVPPDDLQHEVRDARGFVVARGDLAWLKRSRPLLGEADGRSIHDAPEAVYRDRRRGNALVAEAYDTVRFTYADTFRRGYIPFVVREALRAG